MTTATAPVVNGAKPMSAWVRLRELFARWQTIRYLTTSALKAGHRDKVLGHLWNILDPMMFMLVYYFVFGVLFGLAGGGRSTTFMLYILLGVLTFNFFSATANQATVCIRGNRGLIHEINFPKGVFPISVTLARFYDFVWGLVVFFVFMLVGGIWPTANYAWLPVLLGLLLMLTMGTAFLVAYLGAFFADMANIVNVFMRLLFYCSPVFYFIRDITVRESHNGAIKLVHYKAMFHNELGRFIYMLNPFSCLLECFRDAMLWGRMPDPVLLGYSAVTSVLICVAGFLLFIRGEGKFAKYI